MLDGVGPKCALCKTALTGTNQTREHIVPVALGGRRAVKGFICRACNSETGHSWDAELAKQLQDFALLLDIKRQKSQVPSKNLPTASGGSLRVSSGNRVSLPHPLVEITKGDPRVLRIQSETEAEVRRIIATINKRYSQNIAASEVLAKSPATLQFMAEPIQFTLDVEGPLSDRAIVKSATTLGFEAGINPQDMNGGLRYLTDQRSEPCFYPYYSKDLVSNRVVGLPLHCVYVSSVDERILAYVELFGVVKRVIILAEQYVGPLVHRTYAIDPTSGEEVDVDIALPTTVIADAKADMYSEAMEAGMRESVTRVVAQAQERARQRGIQEVIGLAWKEYLSEIGKTPEDTLSEEEHLALSGRISEAVVPLLLHLAQPMDVPREPED